MTTPTIIPCPVGFGKTADDLERTPELIERMRAMGLPMSDFIMGQPDFTKRDAQAMREAASNKDDPEEAGRIRERTRIQIEKYQRINITHWYANHEYDNFSGLTGLIDDDDARLTASYYHYLKTKFQKTKNRGSVYSALGVYANAPVTTHTSVESFGKLDGLIKRMDWVYANGYIKGFPTEFQIALKNTQVVSQCRKLANGREVMLAYQTRRRLIERDSPAPLKSEDVRAWWQSATALGIEHVIVYLPISEDHSGVRVDTLEDRIEELQWQTPIINEAIESVQIK